MYHRQNRIRITCRGSMRARSALGRLGYTVSYFGRWPLTAILPTSAINQLHYYGRFLPLRVLLER